MKSPITYSDLQDLVANIRIADEWLYNDPNHQTNELYNVLSGQAGELLKAYCDSHEIDERDKHQLHQALRAVDSQLQTLEKVTIATAVLLNIDFLTVIHDWIEEHFSASIVIDPQLDKSILGGIKIWWRGIYVDLSILSKLASLKPIAI